MSIQTATMQDLDELLALMRKNGRGQDAQDLSAVVGHVALLERQLNAVTEELRGVRKDLAKMQEPGPAAQAYRKLADGLHRQMAATRRLLASLKDSVVDGVKNTLAAVKQGGISALDGTLRLLHVKEGLEAISAGLNGAAKNAGATSRKVAAMSSEYREAGKHLRNVGRAIRGKEPLADKKPEGRLSGTSQAFFDNVRDVLAGTARDAAKAAGHIDRLEQRAAEGKEQRASLKDNLKSLQAGVPPAQPPAAGKGRQAENTL